MVRPAVRTRQRRSSQASRAMVVALPLRFLAWLYWSTSCWKMWKSAARTGKMSQVDRAKVQPEEVTDFKEFDTAQRLNKAIKTGIWIQKEEGWRRFDAFVRPTSSGLVKLSRSLGTLSFTFMRGLNFTFAGWIHLILEEGKRTVEWQW